MTEPTPPADAVTPPADAVSERRVRIWTLLLIVFVVVLVALAAANTESVTINWVVADSETPLVFIVIVAGALGWLAGIATSAIIRYQVRHRGRRHAGPRRAQRR